MLTCPGDILGGTPAYTMTAALLRSATHKTGQLLPTSPSPQSSIYTFLSWEMHTRLLTLQMNFFWHLVITVTAQVYMWDKLNWDDLIDRYLTCSSSNTSPPSSLADTKDDWADGSTLFFSATYSNFFSHGDQARHANWANDAQRNRRHTIRSISLPTDHGFQTECVKSLESHWLLKLIIISQIIEPLNIRPF